MSPVRRIGKRYGFYPGHPQRFCFNIERRSGKPRAHVHLPMKIEARPERDRRFHRNRSITVCPSRRSLDSLNQQRARTTRLMPKGGKRGQDKSHAQSWLTRRALTLREVFSSTMFLGIGEWHIPVKQFDHFSYNHRSENQAGLRWSVGLAFMDYK